MELPPISQLKTKVAKEQYDNASQALLPMLQKGLPSHLRYHNYNHIISVIRDTEYLLQKEKTYDGDKWFVLTAALFHDSGFLRTYQAHEEMSCTIARELLPKYGYSEDCIEAICLMIMATKIPQSPLDYYAQILCDADLFYLGTNDFFPVAAQLFEELKFVGFVKTEEEWNEKQLGFLHQHRYFTHTAIDELVPTKASNVKKLEEMVKAG